jgi:hypothetical protein
LTISFWTRLVFSMALPPPKKSSVSLSWKGSREERGVELVVKGTS